MIDLRLDRVSKRYRLRHKLEPPSARPSLLQRLRNLRPRSDDFWAVRDVSFEVTRGETLGIIGHNGAGGEITISRRLSALIEVGSGFHQELSGRENIYLSGSILGMRRREIATKLERIIAMPGSRIRWITVNRRHCRPDRPRMMSELGGCSFVASVTNKEETIAH